MSSLGSRFWRQPIGCGFTVALMGALAAGVVRADQSDAQPAFEVASVKIAVSGSGPTTVDPGMLVIRHRSIAQLLTWAYGLQRQRIIMPNWLDTVFVDIYAKIRKDTSKEQIPRMLQTLLADRLKLAVHRESRTIPVYELLVGKDGSKMKEVAPSKFLDQILSSDGPDLSFLRAHLTMPGLTDLLSERLDRCVLDSTGLRAIYDVNLSWTPDQAVALTGAGEPGMTPPSVTTGQPHIFLAIQQSLGLRLEARRVPVEVLVADHVERVPTEN